MAAQEAPSGPGQAKDDVYELTANGPRAVTHDNESVSPQLYRRTLVWLSAGTVKAKLPDKTRALIIRHGDINAPALGDGFVADVINRNGNYEGKIWTIAERPQAFWLRERAGLHNFGIIAAKGQWVSWIAARQGDPMNGGESQTRGAVPQPADAGREELMRRAPGHALLHDRRGHRSVRLR